MKMNSKDLLKLKWYVVVNDLIGGYAISHINKPLSEHNYKAGEGELGDFLTQEIAEHIVELHNWEIQFIEFMQGAYTDG